MKKQAKEQAIDNKELILALEELEKEKGIKKEYLLESIETALVTAYKRNFDSLENVKVVMDEKTGATHVFSLRDVKKKVENPETEITVKEAQKINPDLAEGDVLETEIVPRDFGRIAAQTAKQVIIQKIREAEREIIYTNYNDRKGEIVSGLIQKADRNIVIMDLGKLEGVMPTKEQIPTEHYRVNDKIKGYVLDVEKGAKGDPQVIVSRSHPDFVRKLLEFEIPEIYEGVIEIKSISRDAGDRSKVAVYSPDPNIDPVGSCVGQKGVRIQNVINELNGEKIDVIEWNEDPSIYIASALLPAQILAVDIKEDEKFAKENNLMISTVEGDMTNLEIFKDNFFDMIFCPLSDAYIPDILPIFKECHRILKSGGKFLFSSINSFTKHNQTLEDLIGGQTLAGFHINGFYEDSNNTCHDNFKYFATKAIK